MPAHRPQPQAVPAWNSAPGLSTATPPLASPAPASASASAPRVWPVLDSTWPTESTSHNDYPPTTPTSLEADSTAATPISDLTSNDTALDIAGTPHADPPARARTGALTFARDPAEQTSSSAAALTPALSPPSPMPARSATGLADLALRSPFVWTPGSTVTSVAPAVAAAPMPDPQTHLEQMWLPPDVGAQPPRRRRAPKRWRLSRGQTRPATRDALSVERPLSSWEPVTTAEASGYARRFAADYLSWDELEPSRRPAALRQYLSDPAMAHIGWSGKGRQRVEETIAGRTVELARGSVVVVEVTARVVLYHRSHLSPEQIWQPPIGEATPNLAFAPASAPPVSAPGWEAGAAWWVRVAPPVRRDHDGRLVIDLGLDLSATES
jgi:hypothetical protein